MGLAGLSCIDVGLGRRILPKVPTKRVAVGCRRWPGGKKPVADKQHRFLRVVLAVSVITDTIVLVKPYCKARSRGV